ncbi:MAG: phosphoribosylformimino-5-aminoimidazole carboxamide ribotide isomerase [Verrucomicrobiota bacterium]
MTKFRPCIDLHEGQVKQIVGGSLSDAKGEHPQTNFVSERSAAWFAETYAQDSLSGGHVIQLGPGNAEQARKALKAYPKGLQIGGGIREETADDWLAAGASHVIVTSALFDGDQFSWTRLRSLARAIPPEHLVIDLSCRRREDTWWVATNRWQTITRTEVKVDLLSELAPYCAEFLIHAADVEGKCQGIDRELVSLLGAATPLPTTYAGGARSREDLVLVNQLSQGRVDLTIGSALDLFGGTGVTYQECLRWNAQETEASSHAPDEDHENTSDNPTSKDGKTVE